MKLSILDATQSPKTLGPAVGLRRTIALAQAAEALGYTRYWVVEHHGFGFEADPAPEVFTAALAGATRRIRVGPGGILLNHYSPYKVAEVLRTLQALYPGRIDAGIGRATTRTRAEIAIKRLRDVAIPDDHDAQVTELLAWLGHELPAESPFHGMVVMPGEPAGPTPWILGASEASALRAARHGIPLAFSAFIAPKQAAACMRTYHEAFQPSRWAAGIARPEALIAVRISVAETLEEAERLAMPMRAVFKLRRQEGVFIDYLPSLDEATAIMGGHCPASDEEWPDYVIGTPDRVYRILKNMAAKSGVTEFMLQDFLDDPVLRLNNYALIARQFGLSPE